MTIRSRQRHLTLVLGAFTVSAVTSVQLLGAQEASVHNDIPSYSVFHSPQRMQAVDWSLAAGLALVRGIDWYSTSSCIGHNTCKEVELPPPLVKNKALFGCFEAGVAAVSIGMQYQLTRHGHRKIARIGQIVDLGMVTPAALGVDDKY